MAEDAECQPVKDPLSNNSGNIPTSSPVYPNNIPDLKTDHKEDPSDGSKPVSTFQPPPHAVSASNTNSTGSHSPKPDYSSLQLSKWVQNNN